jgi:cytochrome oxidase Cu insertion factor (SCO1/SenC/PrrC family)
LAVADNKPENRTSIDDLFIHSTMFALVDRSGNIRGWYNESDEKMVVKLGQDLLSLFKEKAPEKESSVVQEM